MGKVFSGAARAVTKGVKAVVQPVYNATLKNIPGVDKALVGVDKAVGKSIPGGWGTVAAIASSFIPGSQLALMGMTKAGLATGLGALSGSGVMRGNHDFNLQGAIVGGAMAYGASQLAAGLENAADPATSSATKAVEEAAKAETGQIAANLGVQGAGTGAGSQAAMLASQNAGFGAEGLASINSAANQAIQSNLSNAATQAAAQAAPGAGTDVFAGLSGTQGSVPVSAIPQPTGLQSLGTNVAEAGKGTLSNIADAGTGIKNLAGFGAESGTAAAARSAFADQVTTAGLTSLGVGTSGMIALEEQQKALDQQLAAGTISDAEYATAKASIDAQIATANKAVSDNPFSTTPDRSFERREALYGTPESSATVYASNPATSGATLYARGGSVDNEMGFDDSPRGLGLGNMANGFMNGGSTPSFAGGGQARFLSGGGDGMSDSIKASIEGRQEARLADGEFVIPADVVSHMGNGSSKAGAKQLYSMMDRIRQARVGTKKQGKQINPRKYMAA